MYYLFTSSLAYRPMARSESIAELRVYAERTFTDWIIRESDSRNRAEWQRGDIVEAKGAPVTRVGDLT